MLKLKSLRDYLQTLLPLIGITDYCPNGLQVEGKQNLYKIGTAVSASLETIEQAVDLQLDALIVHHGIFWNRDSYVIEGTKRKKIELLLKHQISLFGYHLPLDVHREIGNNWKAALDLNWTELEPFAGIGVKGKIAPLPYEDFLKVLETYYGHEAHAVKGGPAMIRNIGLVSGGAYKSIAEAAQEGLDVFITGNFDEPVWHQAREEQINFVAMGHSATERVGPFTLAQRIQSDLNIETQFIDCKNPF